jgi:hypothetical protein
MINSYIGSIMNMTVDVYSQQNSQSNSGAITRSWVYDKTIDCKVEPLKSTTSSHGEAKTFQTNNQNMYFENMELKIRCAIPLSKRNRITSVRSSDGQIAYVEIDKYDNPAMIFEVISLHAVLDPLGKINFYEGILRRVQVQDNDTSFN